MQKYELLEVIGKGSFSLVRKVRRISDGVILCRKEIDYKKMTASEKGQLVSEVNILRDLSHPFIVKYQDRVIDKDLGVIYIIMDYCGGGDLSRIIKRCKAENLCMSESVIWKFLYQLLLALNECHSTTPSHNQILHRDIKPENVLLDCDHNVRLGDFGLSKNLENNQFAATYVGTPYYMSPEMVKECNYNSKSDIWSLGCLIYELTTLQPPFQAKTQLALTTKIKQGFVQDIPKNFSRELNEIIKSMLTTEYTRRPSAQQLLDSASIRSQFSLSKSNSESKLADSKSSQRTVTDVEEAVVVPSRDQLLDQREKQINERELKLNARETLLLQKEKDLSDKSRQLTELVAKYTLLHKASLPVSPLKQRPTPLREMQIDTKNSTPQKENMQVDTPTKTKWIRTRPIDQFPTNSPAIDHKPRDFLPTQRYTFQNYRNNVPSNASSLAVTPLKSLLGSPMSTTESPLYGRTFSPMNKVDAFKVPTNRTSLLPIRKLRLSD